MSIKQKFSISLLSKIITFVTSFVTTIIISRTLGPESNGIYRYILLVISTSYLVANLGIIETSNQRLALQKISKDSAFLFNLVWSIIIFIFITLILTVYLSINPSSLKFQIIIIGIIYLLLSIFHFSISAILSGLHKINEFNILNGANFVILLFCIIILKMFFEITILSILLSQIFVALFYMIAAVIIIKPSINTVLFRKEITKAYLRGVFRRGIIIYLSNISTFLNYRLDMFLLKIFTNFRNIGLYSVAVSIVEKLWIFPESIRTIVFLEIAGKRKGEEFVSQVTRIQINLIALVSIILAISAKGLIPFLYSVNYQESIKPFVLLLPGVVFFSLSKILASYFVGIDKIHINTISSVVGFIVNLILNLFFIPRFGILGAAVSTTISYSIGGFILLYQFTTISKIPVCKTILIQKEDIQMIRIILNKLLKKSK